MPPPRPARLAPRRAAALLAGGVLLALAACGGLTAPVEQDHGAVLIIQNYTFIPAHVEVPAGGTLVVLNQDRFAHDVTSEASTGAHAYAEVGGIGFETGPIPPGGVAAITVPAGAAVGTVVPFFCNVFPTVMTNEGDLTVVAAP